MAKAEDVAAGALRRRLLGVVRDHYPSQSAFLAAWPQVGRATWREWTHQSKPRLPKADFLVQLARRHRVNLNWLLVGVGQPYRPLQRLGAGGRAASELRRLQREVLELQFENARLLRRLAAVQRAPRPSRGTRGRKRAPQRRRK